MDTRAVAKISGRDEIPFYLPHLFGKRGYAMVRRPSELPAKLPLLYAQLTR